MRRRRLHVALAGPASPRSFATELGVEAELLPVGYARTPVDELARGLLAAGIRVTVITADIGSRVPWSAQRDGLHVVTVPFRRAAKRRMLDGFRVERRGIRAALHAARPDVVHAHWTYEFALSALDVHPMAGVTAHDAPRQILRVHRDAYRLRRLLMARRVAQRVVNLAVVSPYLADRWRDEMKWTGTAAVLPDIAPLLPGAADPTRPLRASARRVLVVASGDPGKNVRTLLEAWQQISVADPGLNLDVVGPGLGPAESLGRRFRHPRITFHGPLDRTELGRRLLEADVLVHPSLEESLSVVLLEAMRAGVPVVAGRSSGGVPWTVGDAGTLCDVRSAPALARATLTVAGDVGLRQHHRDRGLSRVAEMFTRERIVDQHLAFYERIGSSAGADT